MAINQVHVSVPPEAVFAVLRDPCRYPQWLVGAKRIRAFDPRWPEPGAEFHHTMGAGPATFDDTTSVVAGPVIDAAIQLRNAVSLRRLRRLLEGEVER